MIKYNLTLADFGVGTQEIVLRKRYGRVNEEDENHRAEQAQLYRYMAKVLDSRELKMEADIGLNDLSINVKSRRIYHHGGYIYRLMYAEKGGFKLRLGSMKEHEIMMMQIAGWLAKQSYTTAPKGIRFLCHCLAEDDSENPIIESQLLEIELTKDEVIEEYLTNFMLNLRDAHGQKDDFLPECDEDQRHSSTGNKFVKCQDTCRVRNNCKQFAKFKTEHANLYKNNLSALEGL